MWTGYPRARWVSLYALCSLSLRTIVHRRTACTQHTPTEVAHDLWQYSSSACDSFVSASSRLRSAKANPYRCSQPLTSCMVRSLGIAMVICVCSPPPSPPYGRTLVYAGSNGICTHISRSSSARRHFLGEAKECTAVSCVSVCMRTLALCAYGHALSAVQRQVSDTGCSTGVSVSRTHRIRRIRYSPDLRSYHPQERRHAMGCGLSQAASVEPLGLRIVLILWYVRGCLSIDSTH